MPLVALFNKKLWGIVTCKKYQQWKSLLKFCELWYTKNLKPCGLKLLNKKDRKYFPKCYQTQNPQGEIKPGPKYLHKLLASGMIKQVAWIYIFFLFAHRTIWRFGPGQPRESEWCFRLIRYWSLNGNNHASQ